MSSNIYLLHDRKHVQKPECTIRQPSRAKIYIGEPKEVNAHAQSFSNAGTNRNLGFVMSPHSTIQSDSYHSHRRWILEPSRTLSAKIDHFYVTLPTRAGKRNGGRGFTWPYKAMASEFWELINYAYSSAIVRAGKKRLGSPNRLKPVV